jgi:hypothetical protein
MNDLEQKRLEQAIAYHERKVKALKSAMPCDGCPIDECSEEHRQLVEWLRKLKKYEEGIEQIKEQINDYKGRNNIWDTANGMQFALECLEVNADEDSN